MTVNDSSTRSGDLSKANQGLHQCVSELQAQKACIREQRSQLRQQEQSRDLQDNFQKVEVTSSHLIHSNDIDAEAANSHFSLLSFTAVEL